MRSLIIRFDVNLSPGVLRFGMVGCLLSLTATDLASESVSLATYYPAPSGVYTNMITTGNTWLSREGGTVEIGANAAPGGIRLTVMNGNSGIGTAAPNNRLEVANGVAKVEGDGYGYIADTGAGNRRVGLMKYAGVEGALAAGSATALRLGHRTDSNDLSAAGAAFRTDMTISAIGNVGIGIAPTTPLDVNGNIVARSCNAIAPTDFNDGYQACPANTYATWLTGVMFNRMDAPATASGATEIGQMYCCPCGGTCPSL